MKRIGWRWLLAALAVWTAGAGEPGTRAREVLLRAAAEATLERYPDADDVLVYYHVRTRYEADGRAVTRTETAVKALTEKGRRNLRVFPVHYTLPFSTARVERIEVLRPDGSVREVDALLHGREMIDPEQMSANIFNPNRKIFQVSVAELEIGDVLRTVTVRDLVKPRVPDSWSDYRVFEYTSPILEALVEISAPAEKPLRNVILKDERPGTVAFSDTVKDDRRWYRWEVRGVPRLFDEPNMPALHTVAQRLLVSTLPDWPTVSRWYWNLSLPRLEAVSPEMIEMTRRLTEGLADPDERVRALFRFVSQEVRYMGLTLEDESPGYEPHDVSLTFANRYGVCRDKAALLAAMLRLAGFEAFPALIHVGPLLDPEVPQPFFNHAVTALRRPDGGFDLLEPTDESTRDLFPAYLGHRSFLVATPEGEPLLVSPTSPAERELLRVRTTGSLDAEGLLTARTAIDFEGIHDTAYRGFFSRIRTEERRRFFEGVLKDVLPGARLRSWTLDPADPLDTEEPLRAAIAYTVDRFPAPGEDLALFSWPGFGSRMSLVRGVLGSTGLEQRRFAFEMRPPCGYEEELLLDLGFPAQALLLPGEREIATTELSWRGSVTLDGQTVRGKRRFLLQAVECPPEAYPGFKQALREIEYEERKPVALATAEKEPDDPDVEFLDIDRAFDVRADGSWTETLSVRKRVLTYAGRRRHAEIKIPFQPAWDEVELLEAVVVTPEGRERFLDVETEQNIMDAAWVGSAPRYPPERILVANLPAVDVNAEVFYRTRRRSVRPFFGAVETFGGFDPVRRASFSVRVPEGYPLRVATLNGEPLVAEYREEEGGEVYRWSAEEPPRLKKEDGLPPSWSLLASVFVSGGDWAAYADRAGAAFRAAARGQQETARQALDLVRDAENETAALVALRDFVDRNIRLAGPAFTALPLESLTPADRTLREGYGHAGDRAVVLAAMLEAAGFESSLLLGSFAPRVPELAAPLIEAPQRRFFNQPLLRVRAGGKTLYLNDTDHYAHPGTTPSAGDLALDLDTGRLAPIEVAEELRDGERLRWTIVLEEDGRAGITQTLLHQGMAYAAFHRRYAELPPEERRRHQFERVGAIAQAATAVRDLETEYAEYPGREELEVVVERYAVRQGEWFYFTLPDVGERLLLHRDDRRAHPLYWPKPRRALAEARLELPPGYDIVLAPSSWTWEAPGGAGSVRRTVERSGTVLTLTLEADLQPAVLSPEEYAEVLEAGRRLAHPENRTFLLRRTAAPPEPR